jgi:hypothetical protein
VENITFMPKGSFPKPLRLEPIKHFSLLETSLESCKTALLPSIVALNNLSELKTSEFNEEQ